MSSVRKRTLPSGQIRWLVDYQDLTGTRRAKQFPSKREATNFEIEAAGASKAGIDMLASGTVTIEQAGKLWLEHCRVEGLEESTLAQYEQHLYLHIIPFLGKKKISELAKQAIEEFRDTLLGSRSRGRTRAVVTSLKAIISEAERRGLAAGNVAAGTKVRSLRRHEQEIVIMPKEAIRTLIAKAGELFGPTYCWRALITTALLTGLRQSELFALRWADVDFNSREIRVCQRADFKRKIGDPKTSASRRTVPLAPLVLNSLREWKLACPKSSLDLVFPTGNGTVLSRQNMHKQCWFPLLRAAGLTDAVPGIGGEPAEKPRYRFHDLRHVAASLYIEAGWNAKKVMVTMGHSSITVTFNLYAKLWKNPESDAEAMQQIEARLFDATRS
jgi:integrase